MRYSTRQKAPGCVARPPEPNTGSNLGQNYRDRPKVRTSTRTACETAAAYLLEMRRATPPMI